MADPNGVPSTVALVLRAEVAMTIDHVARRIGVVLDGLQPRGVAHLPVAGDHETAELQIVLDEAARPDVREALHLREEAHLIGDAAAFGGAELLQCLAGHPPRLVQFQPSRLGIVAFLVRPPRP